MLAFIGCSKADPMTPYLGETHHELLRGLYATNSRLAIVMITDLFGSNQQFNTPGSPCDKNWQERIAFPIREWNERYREILASSHEGLKANNRIITTSDT